MTRATWLTRIDSVNGAIRGAGLVVSPGQVLTCAHVVDGLDRVMVAFPELPEAESAQASVTWRGPWQRLGDPGDIALLRLDAMPTGVTACEFADLDALRPRPGWVNYLLRGRGFPRNLDANGDYVTVTSSSDRMVGNEWLQTDAAEAHLQPLARGFSGAGLYLPETGKVVGMLTDSVLDGDGGGRTGRMLPLSTIRRYWAELDDLLPLSWLDSPRCRAELRAAVANAVVATDLRAVIASALPLRCWDELRTPWEAIRFVGESVLSDDGLRKFLMALAPYLDAVPRSRLIAWAGRWRADWVLDIGRCQPPVTSIVVTLRTPTRNGKTHVEVAARPWVNGQWTAPEESATVRRSQIKQKAEQLISAQVSKIRPARLMVEFAVRADDLALPFDEWSYQEPGASRPLPLRTVPVVVSNLARLDPGGTTASARVGDRWRVLIDARATSLEPVDCCVPYGYEEFRDWLYADEKIGALAYASTPRRDWLDAALDVGVPVMLWCRGGCQEDGGEHDAHMLLLHDLVAALAAADPRALPAEVTRLRKQAMKPGASEKQYGRYLTLYWDNPARLPDPPLGGLS
jgi:vWA-MoxR associated protein C-terminal domain/vWA-MoxR associated protein middle region (VMAP-M) 8/Trypsin-like peptidase domain